MNHSRMPGWYRATVTAVAPQSDRIDSGMVTRDSLPRLALMASCIACLMQSLASVPQTQIVTIDSKMGLGFHLPFGKVASPWHLVGTESDRECQVLNQFRVDDRSHAHTGCRRLHHDHWSWVANAQTIHETGEQTMSGCLGDPTTAAQQREPSSVTVETYYSILSLPLTF